MNAVVEGGKIFGRIVFPDAKGKAGWDLVDYIKLKKRLESSMVGADGYLSICTIDEFLRGTGQTLLGSRSKAYDKLKKIHCMNFQDLPPSVVQDIPDLISHVLGTDAADNRFESGRYYQDGVVDVDAREVDPKPKPIQKWWLK